MNVRAAESASAYSNNKLAAHPNSLHSTSLAFFHGHARLKDFFIVSVHVPKTSRNKNP